MLKIIVSALLLSLSQLGYADCTSLTDNVSKVLAYPNNEFFDCKIDPVDTNKTIVALAHSQENNASLYNLDVLLVEINNGKIVQHLFQEGAFESDAVAFSGITIDTARYKLAPELRAFGIRANFESNSRMYALYTKTISLYVSQDQKLKQVLANLIMYDYANSFSNGDDECSPTIIYDTKSETKRTLAIAKTTSHGYADLLLQEKTTNNESKMVKNKCVVATTKTTKKYTLHFNGDVYVVPDALRY